MKPFIILDIETTGLNIHQAQLLEIGAIYVDSFQKEAHEYETFNQLVNLDLLTYVEPGALPMIAKWNERRKNLTGLGSACSTVVAFDKWCAARFITPVRFAGKNVGTFDLPILKNNWFNSPVHHRILDVGSLYFAEFGYVPSLDEINKLTGREAVAHTALEDCYDVLAAIRHSL